MKSLEIKHYFGIFFFFLLFALALVYRWPRISTPFWVDEFSAAEQAKLFIRYGWGMFHLENVFVEHHNFTTYGLIAIAFQLFGASTTAARLPSVLIGALIPLAVWWTTHIITKEKRTAWVAALLTSFSYFEITWSQQARGYMLQQLFLLLSVGMFVRFFVAKNKKHSLLGQTAFFLVILLGFLTHATYILVILAMLATALFHSRNLWKLWCKHPLFWLTLVAFFTLIWVTGSFLPIWGRISYLMQHGFSNNFWYYHSFLWRVHGVITVLAFIGWGIAAARRQSGTLLVALIFVEFLGFLSLLFAPYVSRYLLPIFPLLLIGAAIAITEVCDLFLKQKHIENIPQSTLLHFFLPIIMALFVVTNGHTFVTKPKPFYSVNHEMREIALIDYDQVFQVIKEKGNLNDGKTAVIDTWPDRARWYLGMDFQPLYAFRWLNTPGLTNGLERKSLYTIAANGEKELSGFGKVTLIGEVSDLQRAMQKFPRGFLFIDDTSLPTDVREYAEKNLHKELAIDHFALDDNPYSLWPATLYSWGVNP